MSALREVVPGIPAIYDWSWFSTRFNYDFHGFFVRGKEGAGNLAIDPVEMPQDVLDQLTREGVSEIILTNRNHFRDAAKLSEATGATVRVHVADAPFVTSKGVKVGGDLNVGDGVGPLTVIGCPGKSPGEVMLHWPERKLLIVGDACVGSAPGQLGLLPEAVMDDPAQLKSSLARIAAEVTFDTLLVADGHHLLEGAHQALATLVATFGAGRSH